MTDAIRGRRSPSMARAWHVVCYWQVCNFDSENGKGWLCGDLVSCIFFSCDDIEPGISVHMKRP